MVAPVAVVAGHLHNWLLLGGYFYNLNGSVIPTTVTHTHNLLPSELIKYIHRHMLSVTALL